MQPTLLYRILRVKKEDFSIQPSSPGQAAGGILEPQECVCGRDLGRKAESPGYFLFTRSRLTHVLLK